MTNPKISVCIPTYNYARFLPDAIESVLAQTYVDFELLVIDNCSTDGTETVMRDYCRRDKRVRFIVNETNVGAINNWNKCITAARGEYIKFLLSDDVFTSVDTLKRMTAVLDGDSTISLVCCSRNKVDEDLNLIKTYSDFCEGKLMGMEIISRCLRHHKNLIGETTAIMFRKNQGIEGFSSRYIALSDLEFCFRLLEQGDFYFIKDALCSIRQHAKQGTHEVMQNPETFDDTKYLIKEYLDKPQMALSTFSKNEIRFFYKYSLWKSYCGGLLTYDQMMDKIGRGNYALFKLMLPLYKIFRPLHRLANKLVP